jgi:hypothetical protein
MLQRTLRYTIRRRSTRVHMMCQAFPLSLGRQSVSLLIISESLFVVVTKGKTVYASQIYMHSV